MKPHPIRLACWLATAAAAAATAPAASALGFDASLRARGAFEANGARDLGLTGGSNTNVAYLDLSPRLFVTFTPKLTGFLRGQFFAPTDEIATFDDGQPAQPLAAETYAVLNEAWLQFNGLTSYPGESLRVGRQLIRDDNGEWIGQNIDAVRWAVDTTTLRASAAVLYPLSAYRTDDRAIPPVQRDRLYASLNVSGDWAAEQRIGARVLHGSDRKGLAPAGSPIEDGDKLQSATLTWIGVYADNGYNDRRSQQSLYYSADLTYLTGTDHRATADDGEITAVSRTRVGALAGTASLRWKPMPALPVSFGGAYTWSSGGGKRQYQQSGLHNNNSYFAGTQTLTNRYNNTVRAELGNLHVVTAFVSYSLGDYDAALVYENFRKDDRDAPVVTNAISAVTGPSKDVGNGLDLVLTRFLGNRSALRTVAGDDDAPADNQRSSVRLRASVFDPGAAYGPGVNQFHYRIILESTLWLF